MPIYDYCCGQCEAQFESRHAATADPPACPRCGGAVRRIFLSAPAVHGRMARGRDAAARTLEAAPATPRHGPGCPCCH